MNCAVIKAGAVIDLIVFEEHELWPANDLEEPPIPAVMETYASFATKLGADKLVPLAADSGVTIGWSYDGTTFSPPP